MRRSLILCGVITLFLLVGCNRREESKQTPSATSLTSPPFPPPPTLINTTLPANQIVFVEISTGTVGTESKRCDQYWYRDGPWSWEYFPDDHHLAIHYLESGRSISAGRVPIGYYQWWGGSAGTGYATDDFAIAEDLPYVVSALEDTRIVAVDASGSIVIEVAGQDYWLEPGQDWTESENTIQDGCHVRLTRSLTNHGLMNLDQIWIG